MDQRWRERTLCEARSARPNQPYLFDVLRSSAHAAPFVAPVGVDDSGRAIWLDLHHPTSRHILVEKGAPEERAEMLRSLAIALATTTRPALLQILAIDSTGRQLTVLETLPHAVTETANDAAAAHVSLIWLANELEARIGDGRRWPDMLLVMDDVMPLAGYPSGRARAALMTILRSGGAWGIHILGAAGHLTGGLRSAGWSRPEVARLMAVDRQGWFEYSRGRLRSRLAGVRMAAADLDRVARGGRPAVAAGIARRRFDGWRRV